MWIVNLRAHTKHIIPFNSNKATQVKTKGRKAPIDEGKSAWTWRRVRHVSMMDMARSCEGAQGVQFSRLTIFLSSAKIISSVTREQCLLQCFFMQFYWYRFQYFLFLIKHMCSVAFYKTPCHVWFGFLFNVSCLALRISQNFQTFCNKYYFWTSFKYVSQINIF